MTRRDVSLAARLLCFGLLAGPACLSGTPAMNRPVAPAELPPFEDERPAEVTGDVTTLRAAGVPILVKRVPGTELVTTALFIRGGVGSWAPAQAGIEDVALAALALQLKGRAAEGVNPGVEFAWTVWEDLSELLARGPRTRWEAMFDALAEGFARTEVPDGDFARARDEHLQTLNVQRMDAQDHLSLVARDLFFKGHPYQSPPSGTPETVAALTAPALRGHLAKLRERSRLLVVAVGDLEPDAAAARVRRWFGVLPRGRFQPAPTRPPAFTRPNVSVVAAPGAIPFLCSLFPAPDRHEPGFATALVAAEALDAAAFQELRARRGLSYFQYAGIGVGWAHPAGRLVVASPDLPAAFSVMRAEMDRLRATPVPDDYLRGLKETALTKFFKGQQTTDALARALGRAQIRSGDWRWSSVEDRIRAVTASDLQTFIKKNIVNLQTVVIGPAEAGCPPFLVEGGAH